MECPWCGAGSTRHRAMRTQLARMNRQLSTLARVYAGHDGVGMMCMLKFNARPHLVDSCSLVSLDAG
eukprot:3616147-Pyramimonas_sp.AAC.1